MIAEMNVKKQILDELDELGALIAKLQGSEAAALRQTDLEIAILRRQVDKLSASRGAADKKIAESIRILEAAA